MTKKSYYEKLKDPRWQKKRLETLNHYEFTCQKCFDSESTLHVHHKEYFKDFEPWEYEKEQLTVLCDSCHEGLHESKDLLKFVSSYLDMDGPRDRDHIAMMLAGFIGMDYEFLLRGSNWEDCAVSRAYYDQGIKASEIEVDIRKYFSMFGIKDA